MIMTFLPQLSILFFCLFLAYNSAFGQQFVGLQPIVWLKPDTAVSSNAALLDGFTRVPIFSSEESFLLNFHKVPRLGHDRFDLTSTLPGNSLTVFLVYQDFAPGKESLLWGLKDKDKTLLELTDRRFLNKPDSTSFFLHGLTDDWLRLSTVFANTSTPPSNTPEFGITSSFSSDYSTFNGVIPEVLVFDQVLSKRDRQGVESYLSLKYGIPMLSQGRVEYINSQNQVYWSCLPNDVFRYNLTGIGRDDAWELWQPQASATYESGLLSIGLDEIKPENGLNTGELTDLSFLVWSDNQLPLALNKTAKGQGKLLKRKWRIHPSNFASDKVTEVRLGIRQIKEELPDDHTYWLAIDRSGTGDFPIQDTDYYEPTEAIEQGRFTSYKGVNWDTDNSGLDAFSFLIGPSMMLMSEVEAPICGFTSQGKLSLKVYGGQPPYSLKIGNPTGQLMSDENWNGKLIDLHSMEPGNYSLEIVDLSGRTYTEEIVIQPSGLFDEIDLRAEYSLSSNGPLVLDITNQCTDCALNWHLPDGNQVSGGVLEIREPGRYSLQLEKTNCQGIQYFDVLPGLKDPFQSVELWGNPAQDGAFTLEIRLWEEENVQVRIFDDLGRLVRNKQLFANHYYLFRDNSIAPGTYRIQVMTARGSLTKTLIIF